MNTFAKVMRPDPRGFARILAFMLIGTAPGAWAMGVSITSPADGDTFVPPVNITLSASVIADSGYTVNKVEFFYGTTLIGTATTAPYGITWSNPPSGNYALTAKATEVKNNSSQTATSSVVNIRVNALPVVTLTNPTQGTTYTIPPPGITVTATASDSDGTISKVEFYDCGDSSTLLATVTTPPYSFVWTLQPPYWYYDTYGNVVYQTYGVIAYATDNLGAIGVSECVMVSVEPSVTLTSPVNGASFTAPASINLATAFNPPDAPVDRVRFYSGTTLIGEALSAPYSFTWQNVPVGTYSLSAQMLYSGGQQTSSPVNVTVTAGQPTLYFIQTDHLNTPRLIQDQAGNAVWRNDNTEPFGDSVPNDDPNATGNHFDFPLRLSKYYADRETGSLYAMQRDCYDPVTGRFCESDPIGLRGGLNTYLYVVGNPLTFIDPTGLIGSEAGTGAEGADAIRSGIRGKKQGDAAGKELCMGHLSNQGLWSDCTQRCLMVTEGSDELVICTRACEDSYKECKKKQPQSSCPSPTFM